MSGFEHLLRRALERVNPRWPREFESVIRAEDFRWRLIQALPAPRDRNRFLRALRLLLEGQGEWPDRLRTLGGDEWKGIEPILRRALTNLESFHPVEESVFKTSGTRYEYETPSLLSDRATTCLLVLEWHLRQATGRRRTKRILLGSLMDGFGLIMRSRQEPSADVARWVEKRLERAAKEDERGHSPREFTEKFVVSPLVLAYHDFHEWGGLGCGSACRAFERGFRTAAQERVLYEASDASVLLRAGEHAAARSQFQQVLQKAERLTSLHHVGLVPILEGYAKALRATGERAAAITAGRRIAGILVDSRRRRQDLVGFVPGAGPNGELLAVWREENTTSSLGETGDRS